MPANEWALPDLDINLCTACGACLPVCPGSVLAVEAGRLVFRHPERCTYCGLCESVCLAGAVELYYEIVPDDRSSPDDPSPEDQTS